MRNAPEARQHPFQPFVGEEKRIAAGEEDVADDRRSRDVVDGALPLGGAELVVTVLRSDHARAGAIPAIHRARSGDQEEHAVGVPVDETRDGAVGILTERIDGLFRGANELLLHHHHRPAKGLIRVDSIQQTRVVRA